jgi:hypothetical protein
MGQKESVNKSDTEQEIIKVKICKECKKELGEKFFYKYELKKETSICKGCKIKEQKNKKKLDEKPGSIKEKEQISGLYVVSTMERMKENIFKVGKHTGTQRKLISRYRTYLIDPIILFYIPDKKIDEFEKNVLAEIQLFRISDLDGGDTEWVKLPLNKLITIVLDVYIIHNSL